LIRREGRRREQSVNRNAHASRPADPPIKDIHTFLGNFTLGSASSQPEAFPLNAENVLWANTVLASGSAVGMVVYTGKETRAAMNTSEPETKTGLLDLEINRIAKVSRTHRCFPLQTLITLKRHCVQSPFCFHCYSWL
jgi:magnesium-transporting ATPase (P-type)